MNGCTIKIFGLDLSIDKGVQLIDGETNGVELLFAHVEVGADVFSEKDLTGLFVCVVGADTQKKPEVFAQVLQELGLVVQTEGSSSFQQDFNLVTAIRILIMSFHQPCVNLSI
jgi:hypothetical protein